MSSRDHRREPEAELSFEDVVDLGSLPPPPSGPVDVHRAPTAVATMTDELMEEIRRARTDVRQGDQTRVLPKFRMPEDAIPGFTDEMPTRPGKDKDKERSVAPRPEAPPLVDTPLADPVIEILPPTARALNDVTEALAGPPVSFAETIPSVTPPPAPTPMVTPMPMSVPMPMRVARSRRPLWPRILLAIITLAAAIVTAFAVRRFRARR